MIELGVGPRVAGDSFRLLPAQHSPKAVPRRAKQERSQRKAMVHCQGGAGHRSGRLPILSLCTGLLSGDLEVTVFFLGRCQSGQDVLKQAPPGTAAAAATAVHRARVKAKGAQPRGNEMSGLLFIPLHSVSSPGPALGGPCGSSQTEASCSLVSHGLEGLTQVI